MAGQVKNSPAMLTMEIRCFVIIYLIFLEIFKGRRNPRMEGRM